MKMIQPSILVAVLCLFTSISAQSATIVEKGDVLRIAVEDGEDMTREATVDIDGAITLPQIGTLVIVGTSLSGVRKAIEDRLVEGDIIRSPSVTVEFASYRPFYVNGSVTEPGAFPFTPGLVVRQALALAGGLSVDSEDYSLSDVAAESIGLRSLERQRAEVDSRIARLNAELARRTTLDGDDMLTGTPEPGSPTGRIGSEIRAIDADILEDRVSNWSARQSHLAALRDLIDFELGVLDEQLGYQKSERELQKGQVANARSLYERGLLTLPNLQNLEREASRLTRDLLESEAFAARARQSKATVRYELESTDAEWRNAVREDLRNALREKQQIEDEIALSSIRLALVGIEINGAEISSPGQPKVVIHRLVGHDSETFDATMVTEVFPGDVLDVAVISERDISE